jgi:hypothetical protein
MREKGGEGLDQLGPERLERDEADRWFLVWDLKILEWNEGEGRAV